MRVVVVGAGAVGSFLGATLAVAGHEVTILGRRPTGGSGRAGLVLADPSGERTIVVDRVADPADAPASPALAVLAVKMFDLDGAVAAVSRWPQLPVLTVQNGVGAEEAVALARPAPLVAASLTTAVELTATGVRRLRPGGIGLAPVRGDVTTLLGELLRSFRAGGVRAVRHADAVSMKWSKLVANLVGNATSALLDADPAAVYADPRLFAVERRQLLEALAVMGALHARTVAIPGAPVPLLARAAGLPGPLAQAILRRAVGGARGGKDPSLRLHLRGAGGVGDGPSEVRWLNGAVARTGAQLGVPTPVNAALAWLVEEAAADPGRRDRFVGRADLLLEAVEAHRPVLSSLEGTRG